MGWLPRLAPGPTTNEDDAAQTEDVLRTVLALAVLGAVGLAGIIACAIISSNWQRGLHFVGSSLLISGAFLLCGSLFGFLFGIPRTLQDAGVAAAKPPAQPPANAAPGPDDGGANGAGGGGGGDAVGPQYEPNTNLEQISDWLTKIIVGVSLTNLYQVPHFVRRLIEYLATGQTTVPQATTVLFAIVTYYSICGFLFGYILTRIFLAGAFRRGDRTLQARQRELQRFVNQKLPLAGLKLDLAGLTPDQHDYLRMIVETAPEYKIKLPSDFKRDSVRHQALRDLRRRFIVQPEDGGPWKPDTVAQFTPIAKQSIEDIKRVVGLQPPP